MKGAGSSGQQRWMGSRPRSTSSPVSTTSWHGAFETSFGIESAIDLSLPSERTLSTSPCGGCISSTLSSFAATSSSRSTPKARHMRRSVPNWLISSGCCEPLTFSKRSAGPFALDRAVDDLRDLEVGIDLDGDAPQLALALEERDPLAQVGHWDATAGQSTARSIARRTARSVAADTSERHGRDRRRRRRSLASVPDSNEPEDSEMRQIAALLIARTVVTHQDAEASRTDAPPEMTPNGPTPPSKPKRARTARSDAWQATHARG